MRLDLPIYRPGLRSPAWLKLKPKLTLEVIVTGGSARRIAWGDWGEVVVLGLRYQHPRTGATVEIRQAVRMIARADQLSPIGGRQVLRLTRNPARERLYEQIAHRLPA